MEKRTKTLRQAARAAVYYTLKKRHQNKRRWITAFQSAGIAIVLGLTTVLQVYFEIKPPTYTLDKSTYSLIGESRDDTAQYLSESLQSQSFSFAVPKVEDADASEHTGRVADAYEATFPKKSADGISVMDSASKISMTLSPKFRTGEGRKVEGDHIVYPMGAQKLIYTLKYNGLKEDIIVPTYTEDKLSYDFDLKLPAGVEARLDSNGNIGVYSSDPSLFGDISIGSDEDRVKVDKARENGEKTHLISTIPAPIVKDNEGIEHSDKASFVLGNKTTAYDDVTSMPIDASLPQEVKAAMAAKTSHNIYRLTLAANNLENLSYPISIDPTLTITSASDFNNIQADAGIEVDTTNGLIRRSSLSGGVLNTWTTDADTFTNARWAFGAAVYNSRIYITGGGNSNFADIQYSTIDSNGATSAWASAGSNMLVGRTGHEMEIINGYIYILGGINGARLNDVDYAKINPTTGLLMSDAGCGATWCNANTFTTERTNFQTVHHNNYIYIIGGWSNASTQLNDVQYAAVNADGSLGTWTPTSSLNLGRRQHGAAVHNGYIYVLGGSQSVFNGNGVGTNIEYAKINSDGTTSSWITNATSLPTARDTLGAVVVNGYLYVTGGCYSYEGDGDCNTIQNTGAYAAINADGSLNNWSTSTNMNGARGDGETLAHNGRIYAIGGCGVDNNNGGNCQTTRQDIEYTTPKPAGELQPETSVTALSISNNATVSYNGYLYSLGGYTTAYVNNTYYAQINANGTLGSWVGSTPLPAIRGWGAAVAHNGYMYLIGGKNVVATVHTPYANVYYAPINNDGSIGTWNTTTALPAGLHSTSAVIHSGYIILAGGMTGNGIGTGTTTVRSAEINTDGTLGAWTPTTPLPENYGTHGVASHNGYLYVSGGYSGNKNTTHYSKINDDGTVGAWSVASYVYPTGVNNGELIASKGFLYFIGGHDSAENGVGNIYRTQVQSNGDISPWVNMESISPRTRHNAALHNDSIYIVGGAATDSGATISDTLRIQINNGGSGALSTWAVDAGGNFANARKIHGSVAYNGYLYVVGGCIVSGCGASAANTTTIISYAPINQDGSLGTWQNVTTYFSGSRLRPLVFAYNNRMYVMGGRNYETTGQDRDDIQYATIQTNGNINTAWTTDDTDLPGGTGHYGSSIEQVGNTIYFTGGGNTTNQDDVFYSEINESTGDMGAWIETTSRPTTSRLSWFGSHGGYMYSVGGSLPTIGNVYAAPINPNKTLGAWVETTSLPSPSYSNASSRLFFKNGHVYAIYDLGPGNIPLTYSASIQSEGRLGEWQSTARPNYGAGTSYLNFSVAESNGVAYVTGGHITGTGCDPCSQTTYTSIQTIPRNGSFTKKYDFDSGVKPTKLISRGSKIANSTVGLTYSNNVSCGATPYTNPQSASNISYGGANALTLSLGTSRTLARCLVLRYTLEDGASAIFPDSGNETTISDFDIYFTANPGQRLRGGRTFTNGADRGLDAQPQ